MAVLKWPMRVLLALLLFSSHLMASTSLVVKKTTQKDCEVPLRYSSESALVAMIINKLNIEFGTEVKHCLMKDDDMFQANDLEFGKIFYSEQAVRNVLDHSGFPDGKQLDALAFYLSHEFAHLLLKDSDYHPLPENRNLWENEQFSCMIKDPKGKMFQKDLEEYLGSKEFQPPADIKDYLQSTNTEEAYKIRKLNMRLAIMQGLIHHENVDALAVKIMSSIDYDPSVAVQAMEAVLKLYPELGMTEFMRNENHRRVENIKISVQEGWSDWSNFYHYPTIDSGARFTQVKYRNLFTKYLEDKAKPALRASFFRKDPPCAYKEVIFNGFYRYFYQRNY